MGVWKPVRPRTLTATVSVLVALAGLAPAARAATIPVTTQADVVNPTDGACSLREAILAVDTPPGTGDCGRADANANTIALGPGQHVLTRVGASESAGSTGDLDVDSGTVTLVASTYAVETQASPSGPPRSPTIAGRAVPSTVASRDDMRPASISPPNTTSRCRWVITGASITMGAPQIDALSN